MNWRRRYPPAYALLIAGVLAVTIGYMTFGAKTHKVLAQGVPPTGSFGFLLNEWAVPPQTQTAILGVMNLDGTGGVTGVFKVYKPGATPPLQSGSFTGTYSTNPDGTGSVTFTTSPMGETVQAAMVISNAGTRISLLQTSGSTIVTGVATLQ